MKKSVLIVLSFFSLINFLPAQTVTGRLVNNNGSGEPGMKLKLYISPNVYTTTSGTDGSFSFKITTGIENVQLPPGYALSDNYPNPFDQNTRISVTLPVSGKAGYEIYNLLGQKVPAGKVYSLNAGKSYIDMNFNGLNDGQYIAKITLDNIYSVSKKMCLKKGSPSAAATADNQGIQKSKNLIAETLNQGTKIDSIVVTGTAIGKRVYIDTESIMTNNLDLGNINISKQISMEDFDGNFDPFEFTGIEGSGFDTLNMSARFYDNKGYSVIVPGVMSGSGYIYVSIPAYVNTSKGSIEPGTVNVQVAMNLGKVYLVSNAKSGIGINALPDLKLPAGTIASNFYGFMELLLTDEITKLTKLDAKSGNQLNTTELRSNLDKTRILFGQMKTKIRQVMAGQSQTEIIGDVNGTSVVLNKENLQVLDQWLLAVINGITDTTDTSSGIILSKKLKGIISLMTKKTIAYSGPNTDYLDCITDASYNEQCANNNYRSNVLPAARDQLATLGKMVGYGTFAIGAGLALTIGSVPLSVVALLAIPNLMILGTMMQMDATVLSMNYNDKGTANKLLDDFNDGLKMVSDKVVSPLISAVNEKAGIAYDFFTTVAPAYTDNFHSFINQALTYVKNKVGPATYSGTFNGVQTEESVYATVLYTISSTIKISISGDGTVDEPYGGTMTVTGTVTPSVTSHPPYTVSISGGGPFNINGSVYGTQSNIEGTISNYVTFTGGTINGNTLTGTLSFDVGCSNFGCADPVTKPITLTK